jgi:protein tyrosine/serine phosphatase
MSDRVLDWEGCANVRDLGGLTTADGGSTRRGAVVRSDNARRLTDAGWEALVEHGVRTVVDLRWPEEIAEDPPGELPIEVVNIPLFGNLDRDYFRDLDARIAALADTDRVRETYLEFLERYRENFAAAIAAVADAREGGVLIHCAAGKDRTGLISALLLRLAGVPEAEIAEDYAESEVNLAELTSKWIAEAPDDVERERRRQLSTTPREAMLGVLSAIDERYGGAREYLLAAGAAPDVLERATARLR